MKRAIVVGALGTTLLLGSSVAANADTPTTGCPAPFDQMTVAQSADLILSQGYPGTRDQLLAQLPRFDKNGDQVLCVMDLPNTSGIPAYVFNFIDNRRP